jgi:hypothetical protein
MRKRRIRRRMMVRAASLTPKETHPVVVASMTSTILNNNMTKKTK